MRRTLNVAAAALLVALGLTSCTKFTSKAILKADNTGTMKVTQSLKLESLEKMKEMMDEMEEQLPDGATGDAKGKVDELLEVVDEKKTVEKLKKSGLEIVSSKSSEKDGWKTVEIEAKIPDINAWIEKSAKIQAEEKSKKAEESEPAGMGGMPDFAGMDGAPKFFATADPKVGQIVLIPDVGDLFSAGGMDGMPDLDEMPEEVRDMIEQQVEEMKTRFSVDEMMIEVLFELPGKVLSTKGCKQVGDNGVQFTLKGGDIGISSMKDMMGLKGGVSATFEIPEGCKIVFQKAPEADKKEPAKEGEEETEKKPKKGGLKIGEDGK